MTPQPTPDARAEPPSASANTQMVTSLVRLRGALQARRLPLEIPAVEEQRAARQEMVDQLEDYVLPRLMTIDAPLLAVVGGSTGAGKSTLVNSLVGRRVTEPGVLRPTTRSPVLVHHPDDAAWFGQDRLLPDLERVTAGHQRPRGAPAGRRPTTVPAGPGDPRRPRRRLGGGAQPAPSPRSCSRPPTCGSSSPPRPGTPTRCRGTSCARPPSARPPSRSCSTGRRPTRSQTVATHLARMLASRGLRTPRSSPSPRARSPRTGCSTPARSPTSGGWLDSLAEDTDARAAVVKQTLDGAIRTADPAQPRVADATAEQVAACRRLRADADAAYDRGGRGGRRRLGRRHPAARRGAGPVAGVRRHRRAAEVAGEPGRLAARPGRQRGQGQAAAGRAGHRRRGVGARDADPRARRGRRRARRRVVAVAGPGQGAARATPARTSAAPPATCAAGPSARCATGSRTSSRWSAPRAPTSAAPRASSPTASTGSRSR